jgi:hypothetical protein
MHPHQGSKAKVFSYKYLEYGGRLAPFCAV